MRRMFNRVLLGVLLAASSPLAAQTAPLAVASAWIEIGIGYDSLTGQTKERCLNYAVGDTGKTQTGILGSPVRAELIKQRSQVAELFSFAANVKVGSLVNSVSASYNELSTFTSSASNTSLLAVAEARFAPQGPTKFIPTAEANELAKMGEKAAFFERCGNSFLSAFVYGGRLIGKLTFSSEGSALSRAQNASLKGQYGPVSGSALLTKLASSTQDKQTFRFDGDIVGSDSAKPRDVDAFLNMALNFTRIVSPQRQVRLGAEWKSYATVGLNVGTEPPSPRAEMMSLLIAIGDTLVARSQEIVVRLHTDSSYFTSDTAELHRADRIFRENLTEHRERIRLCLADTRQPQCAPSRLRGVLESIPAGIAPFNDAYDQFSGYSGADDLGFAYKLASLNDSSVFVHVNEVLSANRYRYPSLKRFSAARVVDAYADGGGGKLLKGELRKNIVRNLIEMVAAPGYRYDTYHDVNPDDRAQERDWFDEYFALNALISLNRIGCISQTERDELKVEISRPGKAAHLKTISHWDDVSKGTRVALEPMLQQKSFPQTPSC